MRKTSLSLLVILSVCLCLPLGSVSSYKQTTLSQKKPGPFPGNLFKNNEKNDLFAIDIKDGTLEDVLKKISHDYGITFKVPSTIAAEKIMVRFSNLKIDEGIKRILASYNTIFIYDENELKGMPPCITRLHEVRIYPSKNKGTEMESFITISEGSSKGGDLNAGLETLDQVMQIRNNREPGKYRDPSSIPVGSVNNEDMSTGLDRAPATTSVPGVFSSSALVRDAAGGNRELSAGELAQNTGESAISSDLPWRNTGRRGDMDGDGDTSDSKKRNGNGQVDPVCTEAKVVQNSIIIIPVEVSGEQGDTIEAWGFDIAIEGYEYIDSIKTGCLAEESSSFMCNQLSNGMVRCGSYTGKLDIEGAQTLFKLALRKKPGMTGGTVRVTNFVDNLSGARPSACTIE